MRTVLAGGRVFDGTGAAVADADVAVVDGHIAEVGAGLDGDEQVDVAGSTLLPGLFDTHVHVMFGHVDFWRLMQQPFSYRFYDAIRNLDATLRSGPPNLRTSRYDRGRLVPNLAATLQSGLPSHQTSRRVRGHDRHRRRLHSGSSASCFAGDSAGLRSRHRP